MRGGPETGGEGGSITVDSEGFEENCESNPGEPALGPCSSFVTPMDGTVIELGPYGASMETNVGADVAGSSYSGGSEGVAAAICPTFASSFGEDPEATERLLNIDGLELDRFTIYRPGAWGEGETYPIITWGNGTCAQPEGYGALLRYVASHGYVIVAANNRFVGSGEALRTGLDMMFAANEDPDSDYYQRIDTTKVGAMGHSQGSQGTSAAARDDDRIQAVILWNGGSTASKPFMIVSGDRDLGTDVDTFRSSVEGASQAAFLWYHNIPGTGSMAGHLTLMTQPERVVEAAVGWWDVLLKEKPEARDLFVGEDCGLCNQDDDFQFGQSGL